MKIAIKMMLVSLSVIATVTLILSWFLLQQQEAVFLARAEEIARRFAAHAAGSLAGRPASECQKALTEMYPPSQMTLECQSRWVWFDKPTEEGGPHVAVHVHSLASGPMHSFTRRKEDGRLQVYSYIPIETKDRRPGGVEFVQSMDQLHQARLDSMRAVWLLAGSVMIASTLAVGAASIYFLARPLRRLTNKVARVACGDLSGPVKGHGRDELGELADGINDMCRRLNASQQAVADQTAAKVAAIEQLRHEDRLRTVGRLASGIAHELGTPLNVIQGRAQLIKAADCRDPEAQKIQTSADEIIKESQRMTAIIRQLLDFARREKPRRIVCSLNQIAEQTVDLLQPLAQRRRISIELRHVEDVRAEVDANQIQQVLTNLVINAIDACGDGGQIAVNVSADDKNARIEVVDDGHGIAAEDIEQIFEPFFTTKQVGDGTGLGLSIADRIVQEHAGRITVQSVPEQGTTFTVELPRK